MLCHLPKCCQNQRLFSSDAFSTWYLLLKGVFRMSRLQQQERGHKHTANLPCEDSGVVAVPIISRLLRFGSVRSACNLINQFGSAIPTARILQNSANICQGLFPPPLLCAGKSALVEHSEHSFW